MLWFARYCSWLGDRKQPNDFWSKVMLLAFPWATSSRRLDAHEIASKMRPNETRTFLSSQCLPKYASAAARIMLRRVPLLSTTPNARRMGLAEDMSPLTNVTNSVATSSSSDSQAVRAFPYGLKNHLLIGIALILIRRTFPIISFASGNSVWTIAASHIHSQQSFNHDPVALLRTLEPRTDRFGQACRRE